MRQVLFFVAAAMFIAFSLSWASPGTVEFYYRVPDNVLLPSVASFKEKPEVSALMSLDNSCESIEAIHQEVRGHKVILSVRIQQMKNKICLQESKTNISLNVSIERFRVDSSQRIDVYFREDEENLKYFGSIEIKEKMDNLLSTNYEQLAQSFHY